MKKIKDKWQSKQLRNISTQVLNTVPLSSRCPDILNYVMDTSLSANVAP
jgi:hypothetical protein